ncbi:MAG: hypothetical protein ACYCQJ_13315 [Nitrososphaerales archaeon]
MSLQVSFGERVVNDNTLISPLEARKKMNICWKGDGLYSLIILEYKTGRGHLMIINIPGQRFAEGKTLRGYVVPDQGYYTVDLLQQPGRIPEPNLTTFQYQTFLKENNLKVAGRVRFRVTEEAPVFTSENY